MMLKKSEYITGMKRQLDELKASSEEGWEAMVVEMEKINDAFKHSIHYFKSQL